MTINLCIDKELEEFIPTYIENRYKDVISIEVLLEEGDLKAIERLAHNIKGNASSFSLDQLGVIGAQLEQAAISKNIQLIKTEKESIFNYLEKLDIKYS